ncbi:MAG: helix-turn-helix transcriptional regulator [[Clostridium] aminophilum]|uniref:helix-turn-helix domain-containing protein n=1 Tax=[Clostridium] aminophilum TaxID=1526 RepID=UPI0026EFAE35|nr:helix-turn-helix transcriptional regulator [[Clostridium] aminophilum]MDD6196568.1 helix-turn-helix transcriptional regulator [[Clostridium] aminophilum]
MDIKDILKNRRLELGITMKELADKVGVSEGTISRWESGHISNMRRDRISALADALHLDPSIIMGWDDTAAPDDSYYLNEEARDLAEFMHKNPDYKVLFDASRKVKPENLELVKQIIEKFGGTD